MQTSASGLFTRSLNAAPNILASCSESTRINFARLGTALVFTVTICGIVLAASFCEFWLNRNYYLLPIIFIGTALFYYILDNAMIMGDANRGSIWMKRARVLIALVLALFNSFLIDYYFFKVDIEAARFAEIRFEQSIVKDAFNNRIADKEKQAKLLLQDVDQLQAKLSIQLDSLNAEASGIGGSGTKGIANIWMAKYRSYQADSSRFGELVTHKMATLAAINKELEVLKVESEKEQNEVVATVSPGINKSLELLHKVVWEDGKFMNMFMSVLILLVSMLLELVPLIAKSFYNIDEYFELAQHKKEICTTNSAIRKQNAISIEASRLMNENSMSLAIEGSEHKIKMMKEKMAHSKNQLKATETYMDELMETEKRWEEKYPHLKEKHSHAILKNAYDTLSVAV